MKNPAILMIGNYLDTPKRNQNVWHSLAERLGSLGWSVITSSTYFNQVHRLANMVWTVITKRKQYQVAQIDVFSGKAFIWSEVCLRLLKILRKPVVLTLHGGRLPEFAETHPKRVKWVLQNADIVVSPSPFHEKAFKDWRDDIRIIPNPINIGAYKFVQRNRLRDKLVWVRAFHSVYNPSMAAQVIGLLSTDFPDIELIMVGPDKEDGSLEDMLNTADSLGVSSHIYVIKGVPHEEIPEILNRGDVFINTTNYDTAPRSLLEAMANGLCIVSTNVGGVPWMINQEEDGMLVPPNDPKAMADAVRRLLTEPDLAARLSINARRKAEALCWEDILPRWESLFRSLL